MKPGSSDLKSTPDVDRGVLGINDEVALLRGLGRGKTPDNMAVASEGCVAVATTITLAMGMVAERSR